MANGEHVAMLKKAWRPGKNRVVRIPTSVRTSSKRTSAGWASADLSEADLSAARIFQRGRAGVE